MAGSVAAGVPVLSLPSWGSGDATDDTTLAFFNKEWLQQKMWKEEEKRPEGGGAGGAGRGVDEGGGGGGVRRILGGSRSATSPLVPVGGVRELARLSGTSPFRLAPFL